MQLLGALLIICTLLTSTDLAGQKNDFWNKNTLNIYTNGFHSTFPYSYDNIGNSSIDYKNYQLGFLSASIQKKLSDNFTREFEFLPIRWEYENHTLLVHNHSKNIWILTGGWKSLYLETAIRYQINYYPLALKQRKFNPYLGVSSRINFESFGSEPKVSGFKITQQAIGAAVQFSPGFDFRINEALRVLFDIPLSLYSYKRNSIRVHNPAIPLRQQENIKYDSEFLPVGINFRLGLSINLSKKS